MRASHTQLAVWRRCRQKYYWSYIERSHPGAEGQGKPSLGRVAGDACHQAMRVWYSGGSADAALRRARRALYCRGLREGYQRDQLDRRWGQTQPILERYLAWSPDTEAWREQIVGQPECHITLTLPDGNEIQCYIDLVVRINGRIWLVEHKFVQEARHEHLPLDAQLTMYCLMYALHYHEYPEGVIYNSVRAWNSGVALKEPSRRSFVTRTVEGLKLAYKELQAQVGEVAAWRRAIEAAEATRSEALVYRNTTHDCHWDCEHYKRCLTLELAGKDLGPAKGTYDDLEIALDDGEEE